jgi:hypothetical protein
VVCHYLSLKKFALITHPHSSSTKLPLISLSALVLTTSTWLFLQAIFPLPTPLRELQLPVPSQRDTFAHPKITKTLKKTEHINFASFRSLPLLNPKKKKNARTHTSTDGSITRKPELGFGAHHAVYFICLKPIIAVEVAKQNPDSKESCFHAAHALRERESEREWQHRITRRLVQGKRTAGRKNTQARLALSRLPRVLEYACHRNSALPLSRGAVEGTTYCSLAWAF